MHIFPLLEMNMNISRTVLETESENDWIDLAQKITIYTVIPFSLIVIFEALIKNLICINLFNIAVTISNSINHYCCEENARARD